MLKSLKVEMLLLSAIPLLVETCTSAFGFREIDDSDKKRLSKVRLASVPGTVLLKKDRTGLNVLWRPLDDSAVGTGCLSFRARSPSFSVAAAASAVAGVALLPRSLAAVSCCRHRRRCSRAARLAS